MKISPKVVGVILLGLTFSALVFCGLTYLLIGDQLIDLGKTTLLSISLSLHKDELNAPIGDDPTPRRFTIYSGDNAVTIGQRLEEDGFITDAGLFVDYAQLKKLDVELEAGTYFLNATMNIKQIAFALTDSRFSQIEFTIIPGQRLEEVAESIDANPLFNFSGADFLLVVGRGSPIAALFAQEMGIPAGASLEGFLYPDTYSLPPEVDPAMLRDILLEGFDNAVTEELRAQATEQGYTMYQMVTLASIVEREAIHEDEQSLIASVYRNRLETEGWRLEADPTVQYALGAAGDWWPHISYSDYQGVISDYNTYVNYGFPPGPIANPGLSAIQAAINPATSNYYFFRADCRADGYHDFSETFDEHANRC